MAVGLINGPGQYLRECAPVGSLCSYVNAGDFSFSAFELTASNELLAIFLDVSGAGSVTGITNYGSVTVYGAVDGLPQSVLVWNPTTERYEPSSGPDYLNGVVNAVFTGLSVTLSDGSTCTGITITQTYNAGESNQGPTASAVTISGTAQVGQTLTCTYTYSDPDGDPEGATVIQWFSYTDSGGGVGETLRGTGATFLIPSTCNDLYIKARVTPYAVSGISPGLPANSAVTARVYSNENPVTFAWTRTGGAAATSFQITVGNGAIDWGDGTIARFVGGVVNLSRSYSITGTYTVRIYAPITSCTSLVVNSKQLTSLNISAATSLSYLRAQSNSIANAQNWANLSVLADVDISNNTGIGPAGGITMPTTNAANWVNLYVSSTGITSLNLSGLTNFGGAFNCNSNVISTLTLGSSTRAFSLFYLSSCTVSNIDLSGYTGLAGDIQIQSMSSVTALTFPASPTGTITRLTISALTGLTAINVAGYTNKITTRIEIINCTALTSIALPSMSGTFTNLRFDGNSVLGGSNVVDFSKFTGATSLNSSSIQIQNCAFTAAGMDTMLAALDTGGWTNGILTAAGTNAAPTAAGVVSRTNLIGKGWTVTTN